MSAMRVKQLSIYIENNVGTLAEITHILGLNNINITALSLGESPEYGILRMIVNNVPKAAEALRANGLSASISDVVGFCCQNRPDSISRVLKTLADEEVFIEYAYGFSQNNTSCIILRPTNIERCLKVIPITECTPLEIDQQISGLK